jgi:hypothetical protein
MTRCDRIIFSVFVASLVACGGTSKKDVAAAKHSLYDTEFATVYSAALEATRELYPELDDNPGPGRIMTRWHQVSFSNCAGPSTTAGGQTAPCDDLVQQRTVTPTAGMVNNGMTNGANSPNGMPTALTYKHYFVRFDVSVAGGRPWRVKVIGHASEWEPGAAMPVEMRGASKPPWLEPRTDSLRVAIWKRIKKFAVPMKDEEEPARAEDELPKTDPASFRDVPPLAAKRLAAIKDALGKRDYTSLRPQLADDVVWSLGGGTGADEAMAMWQADPAIFEAMMTSLVGCIADGDKKVACPGGAPKPGAYQLVIELRGDAWKLTSFVKAE